ncbi:MAG: efflux transporter periplasmic adaptor subunit, partial [Usitatibacter sp.]
DGPQGKLVYLLGPENKAVPKPVTVGEWVANNEWVITSGLAAGDKVIVDGLMKVYPGAQVQVAGNAGGDAPAAGPATPAKAGVQSKGEGKK